MENNKPEKHFRLGAVRASVWKGTRKGPNGREFETRSVAIDRAYRDASGEWKIPTASENRTPQKPSQP